jgi:hypothetical protein
MFTLSPFKRFSFIFLALLGFTISSASAKPGNGLPQQVGALADEVSELSEQVAGLSIMISDLASSDSRTPIQFSLSGLFLEGDINATESILRPMSFTVPEDQSLLIKFVTCQAVRSVNEAHQFDISLVADFRFEGSTAPVAIVQFVPTAIWESPGPFGDRAVASTSAQVYANIPSAAPGVPEIGEVVTLRAQRNGTTGTGGVSCTVSGELFPHPDSE